MPQFVAEALSRRLGRFISPAEAGLTDVSTDGELPVEKTSGVHTLRDLVMADLDPRRSALRELPFRAALAVAPGWPGGVPLTSPTVIDQGEAANVRVLTSMTSAFAVADQMLGGGNTRFAVVAYLASDVLAQPFPGATNCGSRARVSAAAALTQLIGFMSFDNLHHNLAQRYYRAALQLAQEANDVSRRVVILHDMSVQAHFLGHYQYAAQLAEAAIPQTCAPTPPCVRAALLGQAAVCHAALANRRQAFRALTNAEKSLLQCDPGGQSGDSSGLADLEHRTGLVMAYLRHFRHAETALADSLRRRPEVQRRSRMLTTYQLAEVQLGRSHMEQACVTWQRFLSEYPYISSARISVLFTRFRASLQKHRDNAIVQRVLHQASEMVT
ncbi:hypothetical protein AOZ06_04035 [Kibdelosporangium phytohabitans]|uniref:Transcriptional regulator n=1 Tax=Kibdelosporangium phytohabitans TaxID=860235 RepID=A0A0N9HP86_9PSEU|nr:hypothetical protein AOZ06_04035 [Kibdelosporangium phytohabitans]